MALKMTLIFTRVEGFSGILRWTEMESEPTAAHRSCAKAAHAEQNAEQMKRGRKYTRRTSGRSI